MLMIAEYIVDYIRYVSKLSFTSILSFCSLCQCCHIFLSMIGLTRLLKLKLLSNIMWFKQIFQCIIAKRLSKNFMVMTESFHTAPDSKIRKCWSEITHLFQNLIFNIHWKLWHTTLSNKFCDKLNHCTALSFCVSLQ